MLSSLDELDVSWESEAINPEQIGEIGEDGETLHVLVPRPVPTTAAREEMPVVPQSGHELRPDPKVLRPGLQSSQPQRPDPRIAGPLFFDIETIPDFSREHLFNLPPIPQEIPETPLENLLTIDEFLSMAVKDMAEQMKGKNPPEQWLEEAHKTESDKPKPRKGALDFIQKMKGDKAGSDREAIAAQRAKIMATTPEMCRIVAIGMSLGDEEVLGSVAEKPDDENEALLLEMFWMAVHELRGPIVGYNVIGFDLPVILARSIMLGVVPTRPIPLNKYGNRAVVDLMLARFPSGNWKGLDEMCRLYGCSGKTEGMDGSKVLETYEKEPEKVREYVKGDVGMTRELYRRWVGYFC